MIVFIAHKNFKNLDVMSENGGFDVREHKQYY